MLNLQNPNLLPTISKVVGPQDIAMDDFRKAFKLVADCKVTQGGKLMTYQLKSCANMTTWLACANSVIIINKLPLIANIRSVMKGKEVVRVELRIIFTK